MSHIVRNGFQRRLLPAMLRVQYFSATVTGGKDANPPTKEALNNADIPIIDFKDPDYLPLPEYPIRKNEPLQIRKQRLTYQSRKRGMLENDLLLSTFASKYLKDMNEKQTEQYDHLINGVTNDWDIYYWATEVKPVPPEHDNEIMRLLKEHVCNAQREMRICQPNLY